MGWCQIRELQWFIIISHPCFPFLLLLSFSRGDLSLPGNWFQVVQSVFYFIFHAIKKCFPNASLWLSLSSAKLYEYIWPVSPIHPAAEHWKPVVFTGVLSTLHDELVCPYSGTGRGLASDTAAHAEQALKSKWLFMEWGFAMKAISSFLADLFKL